MTATSTAQSHSAMSVSRLTHAQQMTASQVSHLKTVVSISSAHTEQRGVPSAHSSSASRSGTLPPPGR